MHTAPPALLVAPGGFHMLVVSSEVDQSVRACIANLGSKESQRSYECAWRFYREWLGAQGLAVTAVRPKHILLYLEKLRADGLVKSSIGRALTVIRSIYARIVTDEHMPTNPAREVKGPKVDGMPKCPYIDKEEDLEKLLNVPASTWIERRDRLAVRATFGLGWRRAEIARICIEDIDGDTITAPRIKGGKSLTVGLPDWLAEDIFEWRQFAGIQDGPLFPRSEDDRRPINGAIVYRVVRQMCARAEIAVVPPHALRRTHITIGGQRGLSLKERQLAVGHSSSSTTERYDRARDARASKTGNVFADLVRA